MWGINLCTRGTVLLGNISKIYKLDNESVNYFSLKTMMTDKLTKIRHNFIR